MNRNILVVAAIVTSHVMMAQETTNNQSIELNPVVITGTGTYHKTTDAPVDVKVISAKELKDCGAMNLQEALVKLTPNITTHTNGMGTFVNFNGVSDDYIVILENGKRISGDDRWNRISISNIKRIEILNGAASALYGSDAIAGVINIITDESKQIVEASTYTKFNSKGRFDQDINLDVNVGKFSSFTSYNHRQADGWQVNKYQEFKEINNTTGEEGSIMKLTGRPMSTGFRSENISERMEWRFNNQFSVYLRGSYYDHLTNRPRTATYFSQSKKTSKDAEGNTIYNYTYSTKNAYTYDLHHKSYNYGAGARWTPNKNTHIYLDLFSDNFVSKYDYWQTADKEEYEETRKRTHYYNESLKGIFRLSEWNKLSAGIEFIQETLNSQSDNIDFEQTNTYNVFAQDEINILKNLDAVIGARYTYNDNFKSNATANASLFYHMGDFRARAGYSSGYRTPSLSQMYATDEAKTSARYTIYNHELKPEKNHFWNLNAEYGTTWMSISVTGFINNIRDMINYRTMTKAEIDADAHLTELFNDGWSTIRQRDNIDKATLKGINANVKFILPYGFTLAGGYTYTDSKAKTTTLDSKTQTYVTTESPVDKSVQNVGNVAVSWNNTWGLYHLNINLSGHIQGRRYSSTYGYAKRFQQWDLSTRHTITLRQFTLEPGFGIENILNKRDQSPWSSNYSTINPGRSLYISCALRFK